MKEGAGVDLAYANGDEEGGGGTTYVVCTAILQSAGIRLPERKKANSKAVSMRGLDGGKGRAGGMPSAKKHLGSS